jgi:alanine racemase
MLSSAESYSTWVEVDLGAIENNLRYFQNLRQAAVMAIVKANAYGHGTIAVAQAALRAGAAWLGIARQNEALELRQAGIDAPILIMGYTPPGQLEGAIRLGISLTFWSAEQLAQVSELAHRLGSTARLHLKVDTGMSRLGAAPEAALQLAQRAASTPGVQLEGVFTHFARADETNSQPTDQQQDLFQGFIKALEAHSLRPRWVHAANSAASLTRSASAYDMLRLGISLYGLHPSKGCPNPPPIRPALSWKAVLSQVKQLPAGRGVSYGHAYRTQAEERIGTVPVGYADGFRRTAGNQVLVSGRQVPVVGKVCMDQVMVQLDQVPDAREGDEVVLIGPQGEARRTAEDLAAAWGTINYEVVSGIGARVPRLYSQSRSEAVFP